MNIPKQLVKSLTLKRLLWTVLIAIVPGGLIAYLAYVALAYRKRKKEKDDNGNQKSRSN